MSACSSDSGGDSAAGEELNIVFVSSLPASNAIGQVIANGAERAGDDMNVSVTYRSTPGESISSPTEFKRTLEDAIATKPDGLVITNAQPDVLNATIAAATDSGIPVVLSSTGSGQAEVTGSLAFVGNDETASGTEGGEILREAGGSRALVVAGPSGTPFIDQRVDGFAAGFGGEVTTLRLDLASSVTQVKSNIMTAIQKDPSIDSVFTFSTGASFGPGLLAAQEELDAGDSVRWGGIDTSPQVLDAVKAGDMEFVLDQQPYLQGYLPILFLQQHIRLGLTPAALEVATGPAVISADNVDQVIDLADQSLR